MTDELETTGDDTRDTRRDALKKIGVGAAVAWSVPVIASSPALAGGSDAPFPPRDCPACGAGNQVVNGQASPLGAPVAPWTGTGDVQAYAAIFLFNTLWGGTGALACDNNGNVFVTDHLDVLRQRVDFSGFCAEQPFSLSACGYQFGAGVAGQLTVSFEVNGSPVAGGGSDSLNVGTAPGITDNLSVNGVLPPVGLATDTITAIITLVGPGTAGNVAYFDAVSLSLSCV